MTGRERILNALDHKESDKLPVDFGGTSVSGMHVMEYANLIEYLKLPVDVKLFDPMLQLAMIDPEVMDLFESDTQKLYRAKPKFGIPIYHGFKDAFQMDGRPYKVPVDYNPIDRGTHWSIEKSDGTPVGICSKSAIYYEVAEHPLEGKDEIEDLQSFHGLQGYTQDELDYLRTTSAKLRETSDRAIITAINGSFRETPSDLRGFQQYMMDLVSEPEYVGVLLDKLLESYIHRFDQFKEAVGDNVDIVKVTDDLGMYGRLLFSEEVYRTLIKPRQKELFEYIKKDSNYKIFLHTDGDITRIIPDLIEIGVDAINPVDTSSGLDPAFVKKEFGRDITLWGGMFEPANMVKMTIPEMEDSVKRRLEYLCKGGGFIYAYTHVVQPDVDPAKVAAFFNIAKNYKMN